MKFDRHTGSTAAEVPVKFQSDRTILNTNLAASRLDEILRKDVFSDIETGPWFLASPGHQQPWYWLCKETDYYNSWRRISTIYAISLSKKQVRFYSDGLVQDCIISTGDSCTCTEPSMVPSIQTSQQPKAQYRSITRYRCEKALVLSSNKPLPEPMMTQICVTIWHHWATIS